MERRTWIGSLAAGVATLLGIRQISDDAGAGENRAGATGSRAFDVARYGAVADGNADDTEAIQSALDAAAEAGGGTVHLPSGAYRISQTIQLRPGVALVGASRAGTVLRMSTRGAAASAERGTQNWSIERMTVENPGGDGVQITGAWWWTLRDLRILHAPPGSAGVHVLPGGDQFGCFYGLIEHVHTDGAGYGFWLEGEERTPFVTTILLSRCDARNGTEGFRIRADEVTLIACDAEGQSSRGFRLAGHDCKLIGGLAETENAGTGSIGIHLERGDRALLTTQVPAGFEMPFRADASYADSPADRPLVQLGRAGSTLPAVTELEALGWTGYGDVSGARIELGASNGDAVDEGQAYRYRWDLSGGREGQELRLRQVLRGAGDTRDVLRVDSEGRAWLAGLAVGSSGLASRAGRIVRRLPIYDGDGNRLGFIPIYDEIT